ncbi:MAG: hypothetical protein GYB36_04595 [Alphaproteobacteria bacterium]|nr:hypothetical protein [Alphaproteobacteria bacterium]
MLEEHWGEVVSNSESDLGSGSADIDPSASEPVDAKTSNAQGEFEAQKELDAADQMIRSIHFGTTDSFIRPFTRQLRTSTRQTFDIDNDIYVEADKSLTRVTRYYLLMRALTFMVYILMALMAAAIFAALVPNHLASVYLTPLVQAVSFIAGETVSLLETVLIFGVVLAVLTFARWGFRSLLKLLIRINGKEFSFKVSDRYDSILMRIVECCHNAMLQKENWPSRARNWTKVALWNSKRAEYLDRYSTTVAWKIRYLITFWHRFFVFGKVLISLGLSTSIAWSIFTAPEMTSSAIWAGLIMVITWWTTTAVGWVFFDSFRADLWTTVFAKKIQDDEDTQKHPFDLISDVVENFVSLIESNQFGGRG